jgi:hypothetical protein
MLKEEEISYLLNLLIYNFELKDSLEYSDIFDNYVKF